jgi:GNAT superfamily N-acetyltransferase
VDHNLEVDADFAAVFAATREGIRNSDPIDARPRDWKRVSLAFRDQQQKVIAGLYGATLWSWLSIEGLWVSDAWRRRELGGQLLSRAEEIAIRRGCIGAWLGTFDFQAREFYENRGYSVFATLEDFPPGHSHFHLRKRFALEPKSAE